MPYQQTGQQPQPQTEMKNLIFVIFVLVASFTASAQTSVTFTETSEAREIVWATTYHLNADGTVFYAVHTATSLDGNTVHFSNILKFKRTHCNVVRLHRRLFAENERGLKLIVE